MAALHELTPRITDLIVSYGEVLSSRIVAAGFQELGLDAAHADARQIIITDSQFQKAIPQDALIERRAQEKLLPLLAQEQVPVMGGFIASNEAGISTITRAEAAQTLPPHSSAARLQGRNHRNLDRR